MTKAPSKVVESAAPKPKPPNAGKGRVKGVPNKATANVKAALTEAFDELGGVTALMAWAKKSPTEFYKLWGRMMPLEVAGPGGGPIPLGIGLTDALAKLSPADREKLRAVALKLEGAA